MVTTVVVPGTVTNSVGGRDDIASTNSVVVPNGEAARVATAIVQYEDFWFEKRGSRFYARKGDVIAGPCTFVIVNPGGDDVLVSLERWRVKREAAPKP
jgi:hypothetical protein